MQPTGCTGAILASGSNKEAFPIEQCRPFQPAADGQAVGPPILCLPSITYTISNVIVVDRLLTREGVETLQCETVIRLT